MYRSSYVESGLWVWIIAGVVILIVHAILAMNASSVAEEKGHDKQKWFHLCFWLGPIAFIIASGLPDIKLRAKQDKTNALLTSLVFQERDTNHTNANNSESAAGSVEKSVQGNHVQKMNAEDVSKSKQKQSSDRKFSDTEKEKIYQKAMDYLENGEKIEAEKLLTTLNGWRDATQKVKALREEIADQAMENGDYDTAVMYYKKTGQ